MAILPRDPNRIPVIGGVSTSDLLTPVSVAVDPSTHHLQIDASFSASSLAINDGVTSATKTTVFSYTNSNPLGVRLTDTNGDYVSVGGGTQYTDGQVPPIHPVGNALEWNDGSHWQTVSAAQPLPVTATFSPSGTQDVNLTKVGGSAFVLGQQLATASIPVVLTSAQISTLTPPAAITNYAQETGGNLATLAGGISASKYQVNITNTTLAVTQSGSWSITANAGTNLNTSALALETGGNLAILAGTVGSSKINVNISSGSISNTSFGVTGDVAIVNSATGGKTKIATTPDNPSNLDVALSTRLKPADTLTGVTTVGTVTSITNQVDTNLKQVGSTNTVTGGVSGTLAIGGNQAANSNVSANTYPVLIAGSDYGGTPKIQLLKVDSSGNAQVNIINTSLAVTGTFWQTTQPVSIASMPSTPVTGTFWQTTQPVSIADGSDVTLGTKTDNKSTATDTTSVSAISLLKEISYMEQNPASRAVTNTGTFAVQAAATLNAETTKVIGVVRTADGSGNLLTATSNALDINLKTSSITLPVAGGTASGGTLSGYPVTTGGLAKTALPTAVADGQVVNSMLDKFGRNIVLPQAPRDLVGSANITLSNTASETTLIGQTASVFHDLISIIAINTSASAVRVDFRDTTGGSIIFALYLPAGDTRGVSWQIPLPQTTVNTNWTAQAASAVTDLRIFAQYVSNK